MNIVANFIALLAAAGWGFLAVTGVTVIGGIAGQNAPGYPNAAQIGLFVAVPVAVMSALIAAMALVHVKKKGAPALAFAALASLLCVLPFISFYAGGI
ncbi:hypothetical protein QH494_28240 [Sphingomonas sp. AR_OL41]|uniref:hypothetical protein n=1 Tax=Sphingomonas sp. AR_OL41 TaxID=3042729 RepID=UPI00247FF2B4|nr:hypothetical protein [Sphingomonas sp. AR_OL41]MDH7976086.1 hypothetical protein [Sphingomonas sp. AR_OL41]